MDGRNADERVYIKDSVNAQADRIYHWRQLALCAGWRGTKSVPLHSRQIESVAHSSIKECDGLCPGAEIVGHKLAVAAAGGNAVIHCPSHRLRIVGISAHI